MGRQVSSAAGRATAGKRCDPPVVVFLSAGRCGTQWLADTLGALYPQLLVAHEPIGPLYAPRRTFRRWGDDGRRLPQRARRHLDWIESLKRPYVETGWPLFGGLPALVARLRVVHLTRHPVPSALSHATHSSYAGSPRADAYTRLATLGPEDERVFQPHYAQRWPSLSPYEKCLFWWTEVQLLAFELSAREPQVPILGLRSEDLLAGEPDSLRRLARFLAVPFDEGLARRSAAVVDRWRHRTDRPLAPMRIVAHPLTLAVASALGYSLGEVDLDALQARYAGLPDPGTDRLARRWDREPGSKAHGRGGSPRAGHRTDGRQAGAPDGG